MRRSCSTSNSSKSLTAIGLGTIPTSLANGNSSQAGRRRKRKNGSNEKGRVNKLGSAPGKEGQESEKERKSEGGVKKMSGGEGGAPGSCGQEWGEGGIVGRHRDSQEREWDAKFSKVGEEGS